MDKLLRLAVVIGVLMAGYGVYYHYVIFLPRLEAEKTIALEREKMETSERAATRRAAYSDCLGMAQTNYSAEWAAACQDVSIVKTTAYRNCLNDKMVMTNQFMGAEYCKRTYSNIDASPSCSLPSARAQAINSQYTQAKETCANEAKLGLQ